MNDGREYTVEFVNQSITAQVDFFEVSPADDKPVEVYGIFLSQSSDVGDAAEEILMYRVIRGHTSSGTSGSTPTPVPLNPNEAAAGFTADTNNTGMAAGGTAVVLHSDTFNIRTGLALWLPPEATWKTNQASGLLVVRLNAAPTDALSMSGTLYVREF